MFNNLNSNSFNDGFSLSILPNNNSDMSDDNLMESSGNNGDDKNYNKRSFCKNIIHDWMSKPIFKWTNEDVLFWISYEANIFGKDMFNSFMPQYCLLNGEDLLNMNINDFILKIPNDEYKFGITLYYNLQKIKQNQIYFNVTNTIKINGNDSGFETYSDNEQNFDKDFYKISCNNFNNNYEKLKGNLMIDYCETASTTTMNVITEIDYNMIHSSPEKLNYSSGKRGRGRPRKLKYDEPVKSVILWEFIRDLLHNPLYNPSIICWDDYENGTFRFVKSAEVASLWGRRNNNFNMNYEKFSRAIRFHYQRDYLKHVKQLVYQFGKNATGWHVPNPILVQ